MKKCIFQLLAAAAALLGVSCLDNDGDSVPYAYFVTGEPLSDTDYCFLLDDGRSIYPGDRSRIAGYRPAKGQRAVLWFGLLDDIPGYDYHAVVYAVEDIYTGASERMSQEDLSRLADDPISLINAQLSRSYLTLEVAYPEGDRSLHAFYLVHAEDASASADPEDAGLLDVELRHDAGGDAEGSDRARYISFSLEELQPLLQEMRGLRMRVNTRYNGEQHLRIVLR